jgi:trans-feruloyl-CoA hydratase/vanillin synthase
MLKVEDVDPGIRCIGLDRAEKRNAIGVEMTLALEDILLKTKHDARVQTLIFHGIGGHFSAGMDMKDFFDRSTRPPDVLQRARAATEHWRTRLLREMPQMLITAVRGYCFGGAMPILESSAIVFAAKDARFGLPEVNFGFVPGAQIVKSVGNMMTPRGLAYAALTGRPFDAEQARRWGLVTDIVEDDPFEHAVAFAQTLAASRAVRDPITSPDQRRSIDRARIP